MIFAEISFKVFNGILKSLTVLTKHSFSVVIVGLVVNLWLAQSVYMKTGSNIPLIVPNIKNMQVKYVFEINRHGARAPILFDPNFDKSTGPGMLSSLGMRQRFLLGKYNKLNF